MDRLVGKYCKIVTKEPGDQRVSVITGILEEVDHKDGFIFVDSNQGLGLLRINTVVAIKPGHCRNLKKRNFNDDDKAMVGIGTLIVFISMVLIAAVAASVLIQTSENLQQRAMAVGKQTTRDVSSGMKIVGMTGYTNAAKTKIEYIAISVQPRAGSYDIDLNATNVYIQYDKQTVVSLDYSDGDMITDGVNSNGVFHTLNHTNISATDFGIIVIRDSDRSITSTYGMSKNDLAMIIINLTAVLSDTSGLLTGEEVRGSIIPETGAVGTFLITAPNSYPHRVVELW
jgi:flagellin FlaB